MTRTKISCAFFKLLSLLCHRALWHENLWSNVSQKIKCNLRISQPESHIQRLAFEYLICIWPRLPCNRTVNKENVIVLSTLWPFEQKGPQNLRLITWFAFDLALTGPWTKVRKRENTIVLSTWWPFGNKKYHETKKYHAVLLPND